MPFYLHARALTKLAVPLSIMRVQKYTHLAERERERERESQEPPDCGVISLASDSRCGDVP
jgi:hypothetical protein